MVPLRRDRDFLVLWSSRLVSTLLLCRAWQVVFAAAMAARSLRHARPLPAPAHAG
jgi:hypothetical protein